MIDEKVKKIDGFLQTLQDYLVRVKQDGNEADKWLVGIEGLRSLLKIIGWCTSLELHRLHYFVIQLERADITADELLNAVWMYTSQFYLDLSNVLIAEYPVTKMENTKE